MARSAVLQMQARGFLVELVGSARELFGVRGRSPLASAEYPFLRREWFEALEESGAASEATGWSPHHLRISRGGEVVALVPAYLKTHSMGEFVFDHAIAEFAEARLKLAYYPKLVLGVPFTPATGPRFLSFGPCDYEELAGLVEELAPELCRALGVSSLHVLFGSEAEMEALGSHGFLLRFGVQFQFRNAEFSSFEAYLGAFNAKKRAQIRRERREAAALEFETLTGAGLGAVSPELLHALYLTTVDKYVWGRRYLNVGFFEQVLKTMPDGLHVVLARRPGSKGDSGVVAGAINLLGKHALYGRYWGSFADVPFLHFETCLYRGIEETIERRLARFEPGAGGEHKESRGFSPTVTQSAHYFVDERLSRAVADFFERERAAVIERAQPSTP